jgi:hypothetical protein
MTDEALADGGFVRNEITLRMEPSPLGDFMARLLRTQLRRMLFPWEFADPPAIRWTFEPFPRLAALWRRLRR